MNTIKNLLISLLLLGLSAQVFALDFTQATKDTRFILSDANKAIPVEFDNFALYLSSNVAIKNSSGTLINNDYSGYIMGKTGTTKVETIIIGTTSYDIFTLSKTYSITLRDDLINIIKADGGKVFTLTTDDDSDATFKGSFVRGDNEWLPQRTITFCWEDCGNENPAVINNDNVTRNEGASLSALTFDVTNTPDTETLTYSIAGTDVDLFTLTGSTVTFKTAPDHENPVDNGGDNIYNLTLKVDDTLTTTTKDITITIDNINENTITINDQTRAIDENSRVDTTVGVVLTTIGIPTEFSITAGNTGNAFKIDNTGQIQVATDTLDYETKDSYALTVQISKTDADDKTAAITVNINNVNEQTIAISDQTRAIDEDSDNGTNVGLVLTTLGDPSAFRITSGNSNGEFAISNTGQITVADTNKIDYETYTRQTIQVRISKADADDQKADIAININNVNENIIALNNQEMSVLKGSAINTTVGTVALSSGSSAVSTWAIDGADQDKYKIDNNGVIKVKTALADTVTTHTIIVKANGTDANEASATITIDVKQNLSITSANAFTTNEGVASTTLTLVANDTTATFSIDGDAGLFSLSGATLTFNGTNTDFESTTKSYTVKVKATTGSATYENAEQTITVNIQDVNDNTPTAPTFTGSSNIPENTSAGTTLGTLASTDADSNDDAALTYSVTGTNVEYFEITGNQLKLKQAVDYETITTLTITVNASDGTNTSSATNLTFNITDIDDTAPDEPNLSNSTILKGSAIGTLVGTLSAMDVDTDNATLTYVLDGSDKANFEIIGNQLKTKAAITAAADTTYSITIASSDGARTSSAKDFTITVTENLAITSANAFNSDEGATTNHTLATNKNDATFSIVGSAGLFSLSGATLTFNGTTTDFESTTKSYTVKVKVSTSSAEDGDAEQTITVNIQDVNDNTPTAPTFTGSSNIPENTSAGTTLGTLASTDADSNDGTRTYSVAGTNVEYFEITGNQLKLKQAVDYETINTLPITVNASDGTNTSSATNLTFNITDTDDTAPGEPNLDNSVILKGSAIGTLVGTLSAMDVDTDNATLTYVLDGSDKANFEIIGNQLKTKAAITAAADTTYSITIASSDGARTSSAKDFTITVTENLAITSANAFNSDEGATTNHTLATNKNDATFSIVGSAGLFSLSGATLTFNGTTTDFESTTKSYTVKVKASTSSAEDGDAEQTITVNIQDVNDNTPTAPTFTGSSNIPENTSAGTTLGTLASTDADSNDGTRTYSVAGTNVEYFEITGNQLKLKQAVDYETIKTLTITVNASDGTNTSSATNLTFNITDIDDTAPDEPNLSNSTILKGSAIGTLVGTLSAMDVDTDNATLTYVLDGSDKANFEIIGNQLKTKAAITAAADTTYSITIASSDGARTSSAKDFTITVTENLAITSANAFNSDEGATTNHTLATNKNDATFSIVGSAGLFSLSGATLTFNGTTTDFESTTKSYTVKVKASTSSAEDGDAEQTITVNIQDVNDNTPTAPTFTGSSNIPENTSAGTTLGTLASTDADSNDGTRTYSVAGTNVEYFEITGNQLKLKQAVDYETITTLTITINASDGTNTSSATNLTFYITDIDDTAPDEPNLSNSTILKYSAIGTLVGTLSAMDVDTDNATLTYVLDGSDKANFEIIGNQLKTKAAITAAADTTYSITIASSDGARTSSAKDFTITVTENLAITSANAFNSDEGATTNHTLATNKNDATFSIVGSAGLFSLSGATLTFNGTTTDFESTTKSYTVKVKASTSSAEDGDAEQTITVNIQDVNDNTPTAPTFTGSSNIPENTSAGTTLGTLASTDADSNDAARTYSVAGTNVEYFEITGNQLKLKQAVDYETINTLPITVNASDGTNTSSATNLTFNITDIDDTAPDEPNLSNSTILKGSAIGTLVGTLSAMDVDTDNATLTYVLDGSDKANFEIIGNQLKTKAAITAAADTTYSITIASSDGARSSSAKAFTITVTEDLAITSANTFNAPEGTSVTHTLSASDTNATFSLVENTSGFFSLSGATLTFNGANTDFESTTKSYTVKVKATTGSDADENAEQTITANLTNVDEAATVNISGGGKTSIGKTVTLTANATDPDTALAYAWMQTSGDTIALSATDTKSVSFITTRAMEGKTLGFKVTVNGVEATTTVTVNNAEVIAQAVRKESKAASKILISRVSKTVMGRLSHLRKKQGKSSDFNGLSFTNGIKVQFANSEISTAVNNVLGANGLNSTIKIPTRKLNRWDAWSSGKIVIGKSNGENNNKSRFKLKSLNVGVDRKLGQDKIIGFALGIGKENRTSTGADFSGDIDTTQWSLSNYGSLEIDKHTSLEGIIGVVKSKHEVSSASSSSDNQKSSGYFASIAYRGTLQKGKLDLSPYARYDINRVKMKATDVLTNSEASTDEALALGIDANHAIDYKDGKLNRFINLEYKSDLIRGNNDYIRQNAEQEVTIKLGIDYQIKDTNVAINYERVQSTNNKAHSNGIEGTLHWKF